MSDSHIVVVGAGLAGLTCAVLAARQGARVTLLERAEKPGGRAGSRNVDGFLFNRGAHALYQGGASDRVLRRLGVAWSGAAAPLHASYVESGGALHRTPVSASSMFQTTLLTASEKLDLAAAMGAAALTPLEGLASVSTAQWTDRVAATPKVSSLLRTLLRLATYAHAPNEQSAGAALGQLRQAMFKQVMYLDGGWQTLVDGLLEQAWAVGVEVRNGSLVSLIQTRAHPRTTEVFLASGEALRPDAVVVAVPPAAAGKILPQPVADEVRAHLHRHPPVMAACLDVALSALPNPEVLNVLSLDAPLYLSVHSAVARLAPDGAALVQCIRYVEPGTRPDPEALRAEVEGLLDRAQPGWREACLHQQWLPRIQAASCLDRSEDGAARPAVRTCVDGVFLAGDWVGPEGVLADAAFASGEAAAQALAVDAQRRRAA